MDSATSTPPAVHGDKTKARALAVVMHVLFILLIVFGVSWQKKPPTPVVADLWSNLPPLQQPKAVEPPAAPEPVPEPQLKPVPRVIPPPPPKVAPAPLPKPDIALKKKPEKEKKVEPKPEPAPKAEPKKDDKAARLEKEADEKAKREAREQEMQREAADKEAKAKAAAERAASARENQKYIDGIKAKVYSRVAVPADLQGNPDAEFIVSLLPGGELESITMRKSSGNPAYDAAIERAIRQAQPFTVPSGDDFHRNFRRFPMTFRPR